MIPRFLPSPNGIPARGIPFALVLEAISILFRHLERGSATFVVQCLPAPPTARHCKQPELAGRTQATLNEPTQHFSAGHETPTSQTRSWSTPLPHETFPAHKSPSRLAENCVQCMTTSNVRLWPTQVSQLPRVGAAGVGQSLGEFWSVCGSSQRRNSGSAMQWLSCLGRAIILCREQGLTRNEPELRLAIPPVSAGDTSRKPPDWSCAAAPFPAVPGPA
jgi:hypothetical protein